MASRLCGSTPAVGSSSSSRSGVVHQGAGDVQAALHAAAEAVGPVAGAVGQADLGQHRIGPPGQGRAAQAVQGAEQQQVAACAQVVVQGQVLRHQADVAACGGGVARLVLAGDAHRAAVGRGEAGHHRQRGALAGAVGPEQAQQGAGRHLQRHIGHRLACAVALGQVAGVEQRCGGRGGCGGSHGAMLPPPCRLGVGGATKRRLPSPAAPGAVRAGGAVSSPRPRRNGRSAVGRLQTAAAHRAPAARRWAGPAPLGPAPGRCRATA